MLTDKDKEKLDMMMLIYINCLVLSSPPAHLVNRAEMLIAVSRGHRSGPFQIVRACSTLPTTDLSVKPWSKSKMGSVCRISPSTKH